MDACSVRSGGRLIGEKPSLVVWELEAILGVAFFVLLAPLLLFPFVGHLYRRYGRLPVVPVLVGVGGALYRCGLVAFTLFPLPDSAAACTHEGAGWRLEPLASWREVVDAGRKLGPVRLLSSSVFLQELMNVVLFVPLVLLLGYRTRLAWWAVGGIALGGSMLIELTQEPQSGASMSVPTGRRVRRPHDQHNRRIAGPRHGPSRNDQLPWPTPASGPEQTRPTLGRRTVAAPLDVAALALTSFLLHAGVTAIALVLVATQVLVVMLNGKHSSVAGLASGTTTAVRAARTPPEQLTAATA